MTSATPFPHHYVAIEGNIGAGKTTLCKMLEETYGCRLILEQFSDNPFLPYFYENPERFAFPVELFFMTERHKQLQEYLGQQDLFQNFVVSDYFFIKTLLFAKNNLQEEEYRLFQRLFNILYATFPKPDLLVYLHRPVDDLLRNIQNRGRDYEQEIKPQYLTSLQQAYFNFFRSADDLPILVIDVEAADFWNPNSYFEQILGLLTQRYPKGLHHASLQR